MRDARGAGVRVVMVTGDHPDTALAIARDVGLATEGEVPLTRTGLHASAPADPLAVPVYARLDPKDKLDLVLAL